MWQYDTVRWWASLFHTFSSCLFHWVTCWQPRSLRWQQSFLTDHLHLWTWFLDLECLTGRMWLETLSCAKCFLGLPVAMIELSTCQPIADFFLTERSVLGFSGLLWVHFHIHARSHSSACPLALCFFLRWGSSLPFCFLFLLFCSLPCSRFASLPPSPWFLLLAREVRVRACGCKWYRSRFDSICRMLIPSDFAPSGCLRWPFSASSLVTYPPSSPVVLPSACFLFPLFFALLHGLTHTHTHNLNIQTPKEYWGTLRTTKVSFRMWHARQCPLQWRCEACRMCEPIRNAAWLTLAPWQHYLLRV